ncbi:MAG: preprotein translocase subunit SecE [Candidatus Dormibacteraceae bacterium]
MASSVRSHSGTPSTEFSPIRFLRDTVEELRKVAWPTPAELYRYTFLVLVTVGVLAAFIGSLDWSLEWVSKHVIYSSVANQ